MASADEESFFEEAAEVHTAEQVEPLHGGLLGLFVEQELAVFASRVRKAKSLGLLRHKLSGGSGWTLLHLLAAAPDDYYGDHTDIRSSSRLQKGPAALSLHSRIQELLAADKSCLEVVDGRGCTALYHAAANCRLERFFFLIHCCKASANRYIARLEQTPADALQAAVLSRIAPGSIPRLPSTFDAPPIRKLDSADSLKSFSSSKSSASSSSSSWRGTSHDGFSLSSHFTLLLALAPSANGKGDEDERARGPPPAYLNHPHLHQALTREGSPASCCRVWGSNVNYALGCKNWPQKSCSDLPPTALRIAKGKSPIAMLATARHCSAAVSSEGQLYLWGSATNGVLANVSDAGQIVSQPTLASAFARHCRVVSVTLSESHLALVTADGRVFTAGSNDCGQLGRPTKAAATTTSRRKAVETDHQSKGLQEVKGPLEGRTVTLIACGNSHTVCVTSDGRVYSWGSNKQGQLGVPMSKGGPTHSAVPVLVPVQSEYPLLHICAGEGYQSVAASNSDVHWWGCDRQPTRVLFPFGSPGQFNAKLLKRNENFHLSEQPWQISSFAGNDKHVFVVAMLKLYWFTPGERNSANHPSPARLLELPASRLPLAVFAGGNRVAVITTGLQALFFRMTPPAHGVVLPESDPDNPTSLCDQRLAYLALGPFHTLSLQLDIRRPSRPHLAPSSSQLTEHFRQLLLSGSGADLLATVGEHTRRCHSYILHARRATALLEMIEAGPLSMPLPALDSLLLWLYTDDDSHLSPADLKRLPAPVRASLSDLGALADDMAHFYSALQSAASPPQGNGDLIEICAGDRVFRCHRSLLMVRSEYFRAMFSIGMRESSQSSSGLTMSCSPKMANSLLYYLYSGNLGPKLDTVSSLLEAYQAADEHLLTGLKNACITELIPRLSTDNVNTVLDHTDNGFHSELKSVCVEFCALNIDHLCQANRTRELSPAVISEIDALVTSSGVSTPSTWTDMIQAISISVPDLHSIDHQIVVPEDIRVEEVISTSNSSFSTSNSSSSTSNSSSSTSNSSSSTSNSSSSTSSSSSPWKTRSTPSIPASPLGLKEIMRQQQAVAPHPVKAKPFGRSQEGAWRKLDQQPAVPIIAAPRAVKHVEVLPSTTNWATVGGPMGKAHAKPNKVTAGRDPLDRVRAAGGGGPRVPAPEAEAIRCPICNRGFTSELGATQHFNQVHGD